MRGRPDRHIKNVKINQQSWGTSEKFTTQSRYVVSYYKFLSYQAIYDIYFAFVYFVELSFRCIHWLESDL